MRSSTGHWSPSTRHSRKRTYLGGSRIGEACSRRLVYEYTHTPHDPDKAFSGQTLRIFAAGHQFEDTLNSLAAVQRASSF